MAPFNNISLKQLQQASSFNNSYSLVTNTPEGTFILPGKYFILKNDNVSFYNSFVATSGLYLYESSAITTALSSLSAASNRTIFTNITGLSVTVDGKFQRVFYKAGTLRINTSSVLSNTVTITVSAGVTLSAYDVNLNFISVASPTVSGQPMFPFPILAGVNPTTYTLQAQIPTYALSAINIGYNIRKPF